VLVREGWLHYQPVYSYMASGGRWIEEIGDGAAAYRADYGDESAENARHTIRLLGGHDDVMINGGHWRSPATMPAWAARYAFTPETVRCCRVQEVTEEEAGLAGYEPYGGRVSGPFDPPEYDGGTARDDFASDWWQKYRARPGRRWDDNPSVWVIVGDVERRER